MRLQYQIKLVSKNILRNTPFYPVKMGNYIRGLYLYKYLRILPTKTFRTVLDAGCGEGEYTKKMSISYPFMKINAYDINRYESWNDRQKNVIFKKNDLLLLKDRNIFDFCICIDVINRKLRNNTVLINIYNSLKNGGYFYIHSSSRNQRPIFFKNNLNYSGIWDVYTLEELKKIVKSIGFKIILYQKTFGLIGKICWEIDRLTDNYLFLKIIIMPALKILAKLDTFFTMINRDGDGILIIAQKN